MVLTIFNNKETKRNQDILYMHNDLSRVKEYRRKYVKMEVMITVQGDTIVGNTLSLSFFSL